MCAGAIARKSIVKDRVLFVDDEPNVLDGIRRQLRNRVDLETATSAAAGLDIIKAQGPFCRGGLRHAHAGNGRRALPRQGRTKSRRRRCAWCSSGQADLESTIAARQRRPRVPLPAQALQLRKPCSASIKNGIEQYRLVHAEKHLLENTLNATVKVLVNVLGLINPVGAAPRRADPALRGERRRRASALPASWQYHLAAMISQLGCITLPQETLARGLQRPGR